VEFKVTEVVGEQRTGTIGIIRGKQREGDMDGGIWDATVDVISKSATQTRL
jgi:hypothetical protein